MAKEKEKAVVNPEETKKNRAEAIRTALADIIGKNLAGFKKPFKCIGTEEGEFVSINGRKGVFAYVVQDAKGDTFKVGRTQLKQLGIDLPPRKVKEPKAAVGGEGKAAPAAKAGGAKKKSPLPE